jgi:hypothetical protein
MIWAWCLEVLPEILQRAQILEVEVDDTFVFDCTCGLGDGIGTKNDHEARDCQGKGLMCRPAFLALTRLTQELEYHEFKTTGMTGPSFEDKWEVAIQTFSAILDVERRYEKHVQTFYIHGLIKGKREGEYNPATKKRDGIIRQQSVFCYAYRKAANPPMEAEEWRASYEWVDETGANRRLSKAFSKAPLWELPEAYLEGSGITSNAEFWVKWMDSHQRSKSLVLIGPLSRNTAMVEGFIEETIAEEDRWNEIVWQLYDVYQATALKIATMAGATPIPEQVGQLPWHWIWMHPDYQRALNRLVPRSYACRRFGKRHSCQHETLCFYHEGWADPIGSGLYIPRRPHHTPELEQAVGRGLALPDAGIAEGEDEE